MSSTSTKWTTDTNTKSGTVQVYSNSVSVLKITADNDANAILDLFADQGDDNADKWRMWASASDNDLHFSNYTSGAWVDKLVIADGGTITIGGDLDVDGTANLDIVDIDGAVDMASTLTLAGNADFNGNLDVDGTTNLDNTDIDGTLVVDGTNISLDSTTTLNIDNSNTSNGITIGTATSGVPISIGHTTSVVTINDELDVTGTVDINDTTDASSKTTGALKVDGGVGIALKLYVGTDLDVDGTANLDAVDIDGAVQLDNTFAVGVDGTGYDVKFFGDTATNGYMLWDQSTDDLILGSASKLGIGTTTPHDMLDIESPAGNNASIRLTSPANYDSSIHFGDAGADGVPEWYLGTDGNEGNRFVLSESDGSDDASTSTSAIQTNVRLCVKEGGNVGIGTDAPNKNLSVDNEIIIQNTDVGESTGATIGSIGSQGHSANPGRFSSEIRFKQAHNSYAKGEIDFRVNQNDSTGDNDTASVMVLRGDGRVGIGATEPATKLHLSENAGSNQVMIATHSDTEAHGSQIILRRSDGTEASPTGVDDNAIIGKIVFDSYDQDVGGQYLTTAMIQVQANGTQGNDDLPTEMSFWTRKAGTAGGEHARRMIIKPDGKVGIGIGSPDGGLNVAGAGAAANLVADAYSADGDGPNIMLRKSRNDTIGSHTTLNSGDRIGQIYFQGSDGNSYETGATIRGVTTQAWAESPSAVRGAKLEFYTVDNGTTQPDLRLTINENGNIGVAEPDPAATLSVEGTFAWGIEPTNNDMRNCVWHGCNSVVITSGTTTLWNVRVNHAGSRYGTAIVEYRIAGDASDRLSAFGRVVLEHNNGTMSNQALGSVVTTGSNVPTISVVNDNTGDADSAELGWDLGITKNTQNFTGTIFFTIYFGNGPNDPQFTVTAA